MLVSVSKWLQNYLRKYLKYLIRRIPITSSKAQIESCKYYNSGIKQRARSLPKISVRSNFETESLSFETGPGLFFNRAPPGIQERTAFPPRKLVSRGTFDKRLWRETPAKEGVSLFAAGEFSSPRGFPADRAARSPRAIFENDRGRARGGREKEGKGTRRPMGERARARDLKVKCNRCVHDAFV